MLEVGLKIQEIPTVMQKLMLVVEHQKVQLQSVSIDLLEEIPQTRTTEEQRGSTKMIFKIVTKIPKNHSAESLIPIKVSILCLTMEPVKGGLVMVVVVVDHMNSLSKEVQIKKPKMVMQPPVRIYLATY